MPVHAQGHGIDTVQRAIAAIGLAAVGLPVEVAERDLAVIVDGGVEAVHGVVEPLVVGADAAQDVDLPPELAGVGAAGQVLQLVDELHALALGEERGRLHHVDEQLQLRELEVPLAEEIAVGLAADGLDIHAVQRQQLQVVVDALALGGDAMGCQVGQHIL